MVYNSIAAVRVREKEREMKGEKCLEIYSTLVEIHITKLLQPLKLRAI